ncbi:MAG: nucleotidyl transferase AbiEii/AbiGii toxin family protein [Anaerolineales bacterium]
MNDEKRNVPASIHQRLLNKSHETGRSFNELLQYYGIERLLYRLSVSEHSNKFTLKGALMFNVWGMSNLRPTRDIDLLGHTSNAIESITEIFRDVCKMNSEVDGMEFDGDLQARYIKEDADYAGVRVTVIAYLGKTKFPLQIDIGFADVITPAPEPVNYPTLLGHSAPQLHGYPRETTLAEKIQAMTILEMSNSRMKDFYDVWQLIERFEFDGKLVQTAIEKTFVNRNTALPQDDHVIFSNSFLEHKTIQWNAFIRKLKIENTTEMGEVLSAIKEFLVPLLNASQQGIVFDKKWDKKWK